MEATDEMRTILAKGQFKSGINPLAILDGALEGNAFEAVMGGFTTSDTSAFTAKLGKLRVCTESIDLECGFDEAIVRLRETASHLGKSLIALTQAPTPNPYVAYYSKGFIANPTLVVIEVERRGERSRYALTAFTAKVGLVQGYSCKKAISKFTSLL